MHDVQGDGAESRNLMASATKKERGRTVMVRPRREVIDFAPNLPAKRESHTMRPAVICICPENS